MRPADTATRRHGDIDWTKVDRVLIVKLRSIGDTVLVTPALTALRKFLPDAQIDILLEDWVAPVLDGFDAVDNVLAFGKGLTARLQMAKRIRSARYDVVFNMHGGTTATFFVRASGAAHRVGQASCQYSFLYNHLLLSAHDFWQKDKVHTVEQQLALLGFAGVPVNGRSCTLLVVTPKSRNTLEEKLKTMGFDHAARFAVIHPMAAFDSKRWAAEKFAAAIDRLSRMGINSIAVGTKNDIDQLNDLKRLCNAPLYVSNDIDLPETTALLSKACLFVGNDSGIAHMAAAMQVPTVVIFGSMNRDHWYPWTDAPNEMVFEQLPCQPCPGYKCEVFGEPKCILSIEPDAVIAAIERVLS